MRYVALIYFDPKDVFNNSPEAAAVLAAIGPYDEMLKAGGHAIQGQPLGMPNEAKTVRKRGGKQLVKDGPFAETKEVIAGFIILEAADMDEAVRLAGDHPFASVGAIEVRTIPDFSQPRPVL